MITNFFRKLNKNKLFLPIVLTIGFIIRLIFAYHEQYFQSPDFIHQYSVIAENFVDHLRYTDGRPPGFMITLIPFVYFFRDSYVFPALIFQIIISIATIYVIYRMTQSMFNETTARITAIISAFYPWFVYYSGHLDSETTYIFWVVLSLYLMVAHTKESGWKKSLLLGIVFAVTASVRTLFLGYIPIAIIMLLFFKKISYRNIVILIVGIFLITTPWSIRNNGSFTGGNADHNLYLGLNAMNKTGGAIWGEDAPSLDEVHHTISALPQSEREGYYKREVIKFVKENPKAVAILALQKFYIFWRPYPRAPEYTNFLTIFIVAVTFIPLVIFSLISVISNYGANFYYKIVHLVLYILQLNAIHMIFPGSLRYRFPIEPFLIILGANGFLILLRKLGWIKDSI